MKQIHTTCSIINHDHVSQIITSVHFSYVRTGIVYSRIDSLTYYMWRNFQVTPAGLQSLQLSAWQSQFFFLCFEKVYCTDLIGSASVNSRVWTLGFLSFSLCWKPLRQKRLAASMCWNHFIETRFQLCLLFQPEKRWEVMSMVLLTLK